MRVTATELCQNLYRIIDAVLETGVSGDRTLMAQSHGVVMNSILDLRPAVVTIRAGKGSKVAKPEQVQYTLGQVLLREEL